MSARVALARAWYLLIGGLVLLINTGNLAGPLISGCRIAFSQREMEMASASCLQYVDPGVTIVSYLAGAFLLLAGLWVGSSGRIRGWLATIGIGVGALIALVPLYFMAWAIDFYRLGFDPSVIALGVAPALLFLGSAVVLWRGTPRPWQLALGSGGPRHDRSAA